MEAAALVSALRSRGVRLHLLAGGRLGVEPKSVLTRELRDAVRIHKDAIVRQITFEALSPAARLERAWAAAVGHAQQRFARAGTCPRPETVAAAAKLELDLMDPEAMLPIGMTPDLLREILAQVYAGALEASLLESGTVQIRSSARCRFKIGAQQQ